jgi:hypothetical protein
MVSPEQWVGLIALSKTMFDATKSAIDFVSTLNHYRNDPETQKEALTASALYSTYSPKEVESIEESLRQCQKRFEAEGVGVVRVRCEYYAQRASAGLIFSEATSVPPMGVGYPE